MKQCIRNLILSIALPTAMLTVTGCSSSKSEASKAEAEARGGSYTTYQEGVPGSSSSRTRMVTATVTAIDKANRKVTLKGSDGEVNTVKLGPEVINFDQIAVGDRVNASLTEQVVVQMADETTARDSQTTVVGGAAKGEQPAGFAVETVQVTATVIAIDQANHKATLRFSDGSTRTVAVRKDVDLSKRKVGERVVIRATEAMAISVEKP